MGAKQNEIKIKTKKINEKNSKKINEKNIN